MKNALMIGAATALLSTSAFAADIVQQPPEPVPMAQQSAPITTWDGAYVGVMGSVGWTNGDFRTGTDEVSRRSTGALKGAFAGYNMELDNSLVLGIEGDVSYNWNDRRVDDFRIGQDWSGSVRGRVGYGLTENALLYGAAGWTTTNAFVDPVGPGDRDRKMLNGYTVGAGVDFKVTENMFARGEYRFNNFGSRNIGDVNVDLNQHVMTVGLGFKF